MEPSRGDASEPMLAVSSELVVVVVLHIYIWLIRSGVGSRVIDKSSANERDNSSSFQIPSSKIETNFFFRGYRCHHGRWRPRRF